MNSWFCWLFGHKNTISCIFEGRVTHDQCERCGTKLPVAYPYHKIYSKLTNGSNT